MRRIPDPSLAVATAATRAARAAADLISRNVALIAQAPRLRSIPKVEQQAWTAPELRQFLHAAAGHRHFPALWVAAFTGMRRNEVLGLRWEDYDAHQFEGPRPGESGQRAAGVTRARRSP